MDPMIKCLIWDLDDTLWQGTLIEDEAGIKLLPGIINVLDILDRRGIVQSIASRNNWEQVKSKLEELGVDQYFLYPQCHFDSKVLSMERIAKELNIGLDTLALIDNDPFERFEINYYLPQIRTYDARQYRELPEFPEFQVDHVTEESENRRQYMQARSRREEAKKEHKGSREQFLKECGMKLQIRLAQERDYPRIVELSHRTNQMNSLLERIDMAFVDSYCKQSGRHLYVAKLEDRFGSHGLIGTCFVNTDDGEINLDLFCISCRIEGRGIASAFLYTVLERLEQQLPMSETVRCRLVRKQRNLPARLLLEMLGFKKFAADDIVFTYILQLPLPHKIFNWLEIGD